MKKIPSDPFEAELLAMAEAVATAEKSGDDSSSSSSDDEDDIKQDDLMNGGPSSGKKQSQFLKFKLSNKN